MEATFFSSREVSNLYQTEALLGNYALAYAFGFARSPYHNDGHIRYPEELGALNDAGVYVTPGTFITAPQFILRQFNAQTDAYWSAFGAGFIAARPPLGWSEKEGQHWYPVDESGQRQSRFRAINRPQHGRIRMLAINNQARCYVLSERKLPIPHYIRLGKFMSKARVEVQPIEHQVVEATQRQVEFLLNPADLPATCQLSLFDLISVPPAPLVKNAWIEGDFYQLAHGHWLPQGMRFNTGANP